MTSPGIGKRRRRRYRKISTADGDGQANLQDDSQASENKSEEGSPIFEHLNELRRRLIYSIIFLVAGCIVGFFVTEKYLFGWILEPILAVPDATLQVLGPADKLMAYFKTSFIAGFIIAFPFITYQVWLFLKPGLKPVERRYLLLLIPASASLFTAGAAFIFFVLLPTALKYLTSIDFGVEIETAITLEKYFSFILMLVLAGGLVFQIPLITFFLAKIGVVTAHMMASHRKIAVLVTVFLAAMLTPTGDPINLMLLALPIYILFEISIIIAAMTGKDRAKPSN